MSQQRIKFNLTDSRSMPVSVGRNGDVQTSGILVEPVHKEVRVTPMTSKGRAARCTVALPSDPDVLRKTAAVLLMMAEDLEPSELQKSVA